MYLDLDLCMEIDIIKTDGATRDHQQHLQQHKSDTDVSGVRDFLLAFYDKVHAFNYLKLLGDFLLSGDAGDATKTAIHG